MKTIRNLRDLCAYFCADEPRLLNKRLYKGTACGASISLYLDLRDGVKEAVWTAECRDRGDRLEVVRFLKNGRKAKQLPEKVGTFFQQYKTPGTIQLTREKIREGAEKGRFQLEERNDTISISRHFDGAASNLHGIHSGDGLWSDLACSDRTAPLTRGGDQRYPIAGFSIQTIVEGSDATVDSEVFLFPVATAAVKEWIREMESEAHYLWECANLDWYTVTNEAGEELDTIRTGWWDVRFGAGSLLDEAAQTEIRRLFLEDESVDTEGDYFSLVIDGTTYHFERFEPDCCC